MRVRVRYYQKLRELTGVAQDDFFFDGPSLTVEELFTRLLTRYPELLTYKNSLLFARNDEYSNLDTPLADGDVVDLMPPFSGG